MNGNENYNFNNYIKDASEKVKELVHEKEQLNSKLKSHILSFQSFDSEIYKSLFNARVFYAKKRYSYNMKLEKLRRKKIEYERIWNDLTKKLNLLPKPELNSNISITIQYIRRSLEDIEEKVNRMTEILEVQILDIEEENEIIEKLRDLEYKKENNINKLKELEQKQLTNLQNSEYYITQNKKEALEKDLKVIYENLIKFYNKRLLTHKKMFELYRKIREFETVKHQIEHELIDHKSNADDFHLLFSKLMNLNKKVRSEELLNREKSIIIPRKIPKSQINTIINKKRKLKRFEQKKLAIALNKQKAGKKLDFYELQLILKRSKS
ncbi:MAG: hypothetical protein ACFE9C_12760 [Candidatus Hodarchaeota archaeon]